MTQQTLPNGVKYRLGVLSDANKYLYNGCPSYNTLPYVVVAVGGLGYLTSGSTGETGFYEGKLGNMVSKLKLSPKCTRVVSVETTGWSMFDYPMGANDLPAEPAGADYWVNLPLRRSASFMRAVAINLQSKPEFSAAPHWYLQGGSASSLHTAKLLDVYRTNTDANNSGFVFPVAVALESLPNSGNIWNGCRYSVDNSTVKNVLNIVYGPIFGYVAGNGTTVTACANIIANPGAHNWKFFTGVGLSRYLNSGRKINIIDGANDAIYKDGTNSLPDSWTMDKLLLDFAAVTGKCSGQPFQNTSDLAAVNTSRTYQCEQNLFVRLYQNGGHGPVDLVPNASTDLAQWALVPGDVRGVIDGVSNNIIYGWACSYGSRTSVSVHVYLGGSAGAGTMIGAYPAANSSEPAVAAACGSSGTAYRFAIPLSYSTRMAHNGKKIYIHAIHPTGGSPNWLINNSGVFSVPVP
ncbi:MAG: hypothetical protein KA144_06695 [Xanthomonadaceae bacterium]|nr:hypothetical protein [Xanthomonadaceae bacterium]